MNDFFTHNRQQLGEHLLEGEVALFFAGSAPKSTADAHYTFMHNKNFYYFTGLTQEHFIVAISKVKGVVASTLFIEKLNFDVEKWYGRKLKIEDAKAISGIETILFVDEFEGWLNKSIQTGTTRSVMLDLEKLSFNETHSEAHLFGQKLKERYLFLNMRTSHQICSTLRVIKAPYEIEQMRHAVDHTQAGLEAVMSMLKPGVMEYQVESTFLYAIKMRGADGNAFPTIAASGSEAVILHYVDNNRPIEDGTLLLLDLGASHKQYASDITRTYPSNGKFTERQKQLYNIVLKAQNAVIEKMTPGLLFEELNNTCKAVLTEELKAIGLIHEDSELGKYYYHGVSHYLGLDVHDLGSRELTLAPGMVFTVEPGLYVAEENIGIRIEDDVLITVDGCEVLSKGIIKTVEDIEAYMAK